jgi:outer membrane protein assembly factor BamB
VPPGGPAIADKWPPEGPAKLWQSEPVASGAPSGAPSGSAGLGSPVVAGGRVYLYANGGQDVFYCFDAATGKTLWKKTFAAPSMGASGTVCVAGEKLYCFGGGGTAYCLSAKTGEEIWKRDGVGGGGGVGLSSSFLVVEGKAVVLGKVLTALNADTGQIVWSQEQIKPAADRGANSPVLWKNGGKTYVIQNVMELGVFCVDLADGRVLWKAEGGNYSTPTISGDDMVLRLENAMAAYHLSLTEAKKMWSFSLVLDRASSPIIYKDHIYTVAGGRTQCVELKTGKVLWDGQPGGGTEMSSPIFVNDKMVALWDGGNALVMIRATPERYELLAKANVTGAHCTSPAVADGKLYLRLKDAVACYDLVNPVPAAKPEKK